MNKNKLDRVMYFVGFAGLMVAGFCWGWNFDTVCDL
jgi:hypothetical protein